jgi:hypothetical protein
LLLSSLFVIDHLQRGKQARSFSLLSYEAPSACLYCFTQWGRSLLVSRRIDLDSPSWTVTPSNVEIWGSALVLVFSSFALDLSPRHHTTTTHRSHSHSH